MTLLKMTGMNDDLPLKLGARLPRDYERKANIAKMEATAKALDDMDVRNGPVKWVGDAAQVRPSDCKHPIMQESMRAFERSSEAFARRAARSFARAAARWVLPFTPYTTPPTDAEVRDFYKDRALGRGISTHESTLWAHRMDLRQHLRTDGAYVPDVFMPAKRKRDNALQRACDAVSSDLTAWLE